MTRFTLFAFVSLFCLSLASAEGAEALRRPNMILVFIDDMGWADFSCFGNNEARTPAIDALAAEGIAFEQFYVNSPICSPSRIAISTGTYPQRWNIDSYLSSRRENARRGQANWLAPTAPMLARSLKNAGYATGHFGKWHMGGQHDVRNAPLITEYGFDAFLTNFEGIGNKLLPAYTEADGSPERLYPWAEGLGRPFQWTQRSEITSGFVDAAILFIEEARKRERPFYLNLWPDDVHGPFWPSVERLQTARTHRDRYMAVLEEMDAQLAALFHYVKADPVLAANTLILICSDNGPSKGMCSPSPFRGWKTFLYEGGIRSPLVVWAPGLMTREKQGSRNTASVFAAIDLVPSLLALAGVKGNPQAHYDGEDLSKTLLGRSSASRQQPIFFSRPADRKAFFGVERLPDLAVREGKWKLLCDYDGSHAELYDLSSDPGETDNVAGSFPELVDTLRSRVMAWYESMPPPLSP